MASGAPPKEEKLGIAGTVLAAAAISYVLDMIVQPPTTGVELVARTLGYPIVVLFFFLFGMWLGKRTWPKRGRRLARRMLARVAKDRHHVIFLSDRPDHRASTARRTWEVVGFAAGASVIAASVMIIAGFSASPLNTLALTLTFVLLWASFVLVPYWLFARIGLRQVDVVRWLITPVSRRYADRLRLSNGALLLLGMGATLNAAYRAGVSQDEALVGGFLTLVRIIAAVLVTAATAVAYYQRSEARLARELEGEAIALGIRDGRGMTDGEFLPRLPPPKHPANRDLEPLMDLKLFRQR